jgi:hypothetical protein
MVVERQLNGEVVRQFRPEGLEARLVLPLTHERWPEPTGVTEHEPAATDKIPTGT